MIFVIGDIHGEITKLRNLITSLKEFDIEKLIFIGDNIDKGENSRGTLIYLQELSKSYECDFIIGNHEYCWMNFVDNGKYKDFLIKWGGLATLDDFKIKDFNPLSIKKKILIPFKDLFNQLKTYVIVGEFFISHSGLNPGSYSIKNLNQINIEEFIFQRYDFIKYDKRIINKIIIFGHTQFYRPFYDTFKLGIDTGATYIKNGPLTAFELKNRFFIDHFNNKVNLNDLDLNSCPALVREPPYRIM